MRTIFTSRASDFATQTAPAAYARCRAALRALEVHHAGILGTRLVPTCVDLGDRTTHSSWRPPYFTTARAYDQSWAVQVPDYVTDAAIAAACGALGWKRADLAALAWGMGENAYVALGGYPRPVGEPDALAWPGGPPSDRVRARLAALAALETATVHVPYTPPPHVPSPALGECPDGHPGRAKPWARFGRWAGWYTCETCRKHFDRNGFGIGV